MWNEKENKLEDVWSMGGNNFPLDFELTLEDGTPVVLTGGEVVWTLSVIGQKDIPEIIKSSKSGGVAITGINTCTVNLTAEDTRYIGNTKYEHELHIIQSNGNELNPVYGYIDFRQGSIYR